MRFAHTLTASAELSPVRVFLEEVRAAGFYRDRGGEREELLTLAEQVSCREVEFPPRTPRARKLRAAAELLDAPETEALSSSFGPALLIDLGPEGRRARRWLILGAAILGGADGLALGERKRRRRKKRRTL